MNAVRTFTGYRTIKELRRDYPDENFILKIPKGYEYDGATYPRLNWLKAIILTITPLLDRTDAVIIHDYLYKYRGFDVFTRKQVDKEIFYNELKRYYSKEVSWLLSRAVYLFSKILWST